MINITKENDKITFRGHSLPDVCAACSSIMYTTINALYKYDENCIKYKDFLDLEKEEHYDIIPSDEVEINILKHDSFIDLLINNMFDMLVDLQSDTKNCINIGGI